MKNPTPITDKLIATEKAIRRYRNLDIEGLGKNDIKTPYFHYFVDSVKRAEENGNKDPLEVVRDWAIYMDERLNLTEHELCKRQIDPLK